LYAGTQIPHHLSEHAQHFGSAKHGHLLNTELPFGVMQPTLDLPYEPAMLFLNLMSDRHRMRRCAGRRMPNSAAAFTAPEQRWPAMFVLVLVPILKRSNKVQVQVPTGCMLA